MPAPNITVGNLLILSLKEQREKSMCILDFSGFLSKLSNISMGYKTNF